MTNQSIIEDILQATRRRLRDGPAWKNVRCSKCQGLGVVVKTTYHFADADGTVNPEDYDANCPACAGRGVELRVLLAHVDVQGDCHCATCDPIADAVREFQSDHVPIASRMRPLPGALEQTRDAVARNWLG